MVSWLVRLCGSDSGSHALYTSDIRLLKPTLTIRRARGHLSICRALPLRASIYQIMLLGDRLVCVETMVVNMAVH